ncbi:MAG: hypothetical protein JJT81_11835 [Rubellimicrobium sp.]|nr:hypothetical protein [Rubellimicrobium sp.]
MTQGNRKARRAWAAARKRHIRPGHVYIAEIQHDPDCMIYSTERTCTCNPTRILKDDRGRELARVENAGFYDPLEMAEVMP